MQQPQVTDLPLDAVEIRTAHARTQRRAVLGLVLAAPCPHQSDDQQQQQQRSGGGNPARAAIDMEHYDPPNASRLTDGRAQTVRSVARPRSLLPW